MDLSLHHRASASQVSPTALGATITAASPHRVGATVSNPLIQATASNSPLHLLLLGQYGD